MSNFWDYNVWGFMILVTVLLGSLLGGNILKKAIPALKRTLIPTSVTLLMATIYKTHTEYLNLPRLISYA